MMPTSKNSQSGFTLVELLIAVVILAIGLLGLAQLQITAMKANSQSATSTAAAALAQKIVEEIAAMGADDTMFDGPSGGYLTWPGSPVTVAGGGTYAITYKVDEVNPDPGDTSIKVTNLYKVSIRIESTTELMHVLGSQTRLAEAVTLKRAI
jgi:type IV pilus assembly protein PilV